MLIKSDASSSSSASSNPTQTTCGNCGVEELRLLHHVRHRGTFRRLCTTCVLRLHPQSFCPSCFDVYNSPPPPAVTCSKCYSSSHSECVGGSHLNPYVCPLCVNPNSLIFAPKKVKDLVRETPEAANGVKDGASGEYRVIDKENAKILLAAAKISAVSMSKAAVAARAEAERRAKEAAFTRKRARAALEHVAYLVAREKLKKKERLGSRDGCGSNGNGNGNVVGIMARNSGNRSNIAVGNSNPAVTRGGEKEENGVGNAVRGDGSSDVLAALNAVELREGEKDGQSNPGNVGSGQPSNGVIPMDVEENGGGRLESNVGMNDHHGGAAAVENVSNGDVLAHQPRDDNHQQTAAEQNSNASGH